MVDGLHISIWYRTKKALSNTLSGKGGGWGEEMMGAMELMYSISLTGIVTMKPPCITNTSL
jgi:hypothetical protein